MIGVPTIVVGMYYGKAQCVPSLMFRQPLWEYIPAGLIGTMFPQLFGNPFQQALMENKSVKKC